VCPSSCLATGYLCRPGIWWLVNRWPSILIHWKWCQLTSPFNYISNCPTFTASWLDELDTDLNSSECSICRSGCVLSESRLDNNCVYHRVSNLFISFTGWSDSLFFWHDPYWLLSKTYWDIHKELGLYFYLNSIANPVTHK